MEKTLPAEYFIQGVTTSGRTFRPSDWSERLCGVMSTFGPKAKGPNSYLQYSIYVRPTMIGEVKMVIVDSRLRNVEPMAFEFVMNFAKDNDLVVSEACELSLPYESHSRPPKIRLEKTSLISDANSVHSVARSGADLTA
jgi:hypothetical protein